MPLVLTIAEGKGRGQSYRFELDRITIGRDAGNQVVLNDPGVSRSHARIERQDGRWVLLDAGSVNGTDLNGAVIEGPSPLHAGDRIGVGPLTFEFSAPADAADTRVTAAPGREQQTRISAGLESWRRLPRQVKIAAACVALLLLIGVALAAVRASDPGGGQDALASAGSNQVTSVEAGPGKERARVGGLSITAGDLKAARQAWERGRRKLEERRVAPRNLYDAWKALVEARRQMEGLAQKPALYAEVDRLIRDAERELEKQCGKLLFAAARFERYGQEERAQQTYREVLLHFPGEDPAGCRKKAQANLVSAEAETARE